MDFAEQKGIFEHIQKHGFTSICALLHSTVSNNSHLIRYHKSANSQTRAQLFKASLA